MIPDPQYATRIFTLLSRSIWLIMAWTFGTLVGQLILFARQTASV